MILNCIFGLTLIYGLICQGASRSSYVLQPSVFYRGVAYSGFRAQGPDVKPQEVLTVPQIEEDMRSLKQSGVQWIRTYSTDLGCDLIPTIAKNFGIDTIIGTWVEEGQKGIDFWYEELKRAKALLNKDNRLVPIIMLGNELMYESRQSPETILEMVRAAKQEDLYVAVNDVPHVLLNESYFSLLGEVDIIVVHTHPFFTPLRRKDGTYVQGTRLSPDATGANDVVEAALLIQRTHPEKMLWIGETGYPTGDNKQGPNHCVWCSETNQQYFFEALYHLAQRNSLGVFAFAAFDEDWKSQKDQEAGSGPYWGIFHKDRTPKPSAITLARWLSTNSPIDTVDMCRVAIDQSRCRPKAGIPDEDIQSALEWTCGDDGQVDCEPLRFNILLKNCPLYSQAAWAFERYYYQEHLKPSACDFKGVAEVVHNGPVITQTTNLAIQSDEASPSSSNKPTSSWALKVTILCIGVAVAGVGTVLLPIARRRMSYQRLEPAFQI